MKYTTIDVVTILLKDLHTLEHYDQITIMGQNKKYCVVLGFSPIQRNNLDCLTSEDLPLRVLATIKHSPRYFSSIEQAFRYLEDIGLYPKMSIRLSRGGEINSK